MVKVRKFSFSYGFIGDDLGLKEKIRFSLSTEGMINNLEFDDCKDLKINYNHLNHNKIILPGLINSHVHIGDSFVKEAGYNKGLIETVAPPDGIKHIQLKQGRRKQKLKGIKEAAREMISNGITCFIDFRENSVEGINLLKKALNEQPIKCLILGRFTQAGEIKEIFRNAEGIGLSSYSKVDKEISAIMARYKKKYDKLVSCHHAELIRKPEQFEKLIEDGIIDIIVHGTQLNATDLYKMQQSNIKLILCPRCNGYFGVGFPPIVEVIDQNIPISIGTDNIMANAPNLFEEIRYLYLLYRVLNNRTNSNFRLDAKKLLQMITINAAQNFNLENEIGSIMEGKQADFIVIDLNSSNYYTNILDQDNIYPLIVQRTTPENIKEVYIKGEKVFERL
ncbi:MAG: Chlorohydrolase (modular protein) [Promethearchaeota archaeon]|nr:MAG: Chlorohydrolase (modular protein) [Candidatus Lokiarchaeota archaeon]